MCDCATCVMVYMEVQKGNNAMRKKIHAAEHGVSTACVRRKAKDVSDESMTLLGDAWLGYVKVKRS
jgi:hypothetical protein